MRASTFFIVRFVFNILDNWSFKKNPANNPNNLMCFLFSIKL